MQEAGSSTPGRGPTAARRRIGVVTTGGTIAAPDHSATAGGPGGAGETRDADGARVLSERLVLGAGGGELLASLVRSPLQKMSEDMAPQDWEAVAGAVRELCELEGATAVLVLHGTDTLAWTAAALSFLLADLQAPVALTGANVPAAAPGSDAPVNVRAALVALAAIPRGTFVVFAGGRGEPAAVVRGTRARKVRAGGRAFAAVGHGLLGEVRRGAFVCADDPVAAWAGAAEHQPPARVRAALDARVLHVRLHPGLDLDAVHSAVVHGDVRGVVVELYASATGPRATAERYSLPVFVRRCVEAGVFVATALAAAGEGGPPAPYASASAIADAGAVLLGDMLPETATVKLMWALAQEGDAGALRQLMLAPIAGELTPQRGRP